MKGPSLFWEKEWGTIGADTYQQRIVPLIDGEIQKHPEVVLMQDRAPGRRAQSTLDDLLERGIMKVQWPSFSPDLNPIESLWNYI